MQTLIAAVNAHGGREAVMARDDVLLKIANAVRCQSSVTRALN